MADASELTRELIQRRAYQLYEERGRRAGNELQDWLDAERELSAPDLRRAAARGTRS